MTSSIASDAGHHLSGSVSVSLPVFHVSRAVSVLCLASSFSITFLSSSLWSRESALHSSRLSTIPQSGWTVFCWSLVCWWTHGSAFQLLWQCGGGPLCPRFRFLWVCTQERNRWVIWKPCTEPEDLRGCCSSLHLLVLRLPLHTHGLFLPSTLPRGRSGGAASKGPLTLRLPSGLSYQVKGRRGRRGGGGPCDPPTHAVVSADRVSSHPASPPGVWKMLPFLPGGSDDSPQARVVRRAPPTAVAALNPSSAVPSSLLWE